MPPRRDASGPTTRPVDAGLPPSAELPTVAIKRAPHRARTKGRKRHGTRCLCRVATIVLCAVAFGLFRYVSLPPNASTRASPNDTSTTPPVSSILGQDAYTFQVATFNVWFGPMANGEPFPKARMQAICQVLDDEHSASNPLWSVGLQEVIPETALLLQSGLSAMGYQLFHQPPPVSYGCALAVHSSLKLLQQGWIPYRTTSMNRGFLYARAHVPNSTHEILFITTHLESFTGFGYTGRTQRLQQIEQVQTFAVQQLEAHSNLQVVIVSGDMNWDDEPATGSIDPVMSTCFTEDWSDTWLTTIQSKNASCWTYDKMSNPMLSGTLQRRFDRILVRGAARALATRLLGTSALPGLLWTKYTSYSTEINTLTLPSDHYGYLASFQVG